MASSTNLSRKREENIKNKFSVIGTDLLGFMKLQGDEYHPVHAAPKQNIAPTPSIVVQTNKIGNKFIKLNDKYVPVIRVPDKNLKSMVASSSNIETTHANLRRLSFLEDLKSVKCDYKVLPRKNLRIKTKQIEEYDTKQTEQYDTKQKDHESMKKNLKYKVLNSTIPKDEQDQVLQDLEKAHDDIFSLQKDLQDMATKNTFYEHEIMAYKKQVRNLQDSLDVLTKQYNKRTCQKCDHQISRITITCSTQTENVQHSHTARPLKRKKSVGGARTGTPQRQGSPKKAAMKELRTYGKKLITNPKMIKIDMPPPKKNLLPEKCIEKNYESETDIEEIEEVSAPSKPSTVMEIDDVEEEPITLATLLADCDHAGKADLAKPLEISKNSTAEVRLHELESQLSEIKAEEEMMATNEIQKIVANSDGDINLNRVLGDLCSKNVSLDLQNISNSMNIIGKNVNMGCGLKVPTINLALLENTQMGPQLDSIERWKLKLLTCWKHCDIPDEKGDYPLHNAVINDDYSAVKRQCTVLKLKKIPIDIENMDGHTPLHLALIHKVNLQIVRELMIFDADFSMVDNRGNNGFHLAVMHKYLSMLETEGLITNDESINSFNYDGLTPIHLCSKDEMISELKILLKHGANVNLRDQKSGRTVLFHAVENNAGAIIRKLISSGADKKIENYMGITPFDLVYEKERTVPGLLKLFTNHQQIVE